MGLFQRSREEHSEIKYSVSYGDETTKLVVGLGNPGTQYNQTRHNIGFMVLDALVEAENGSWSLKKDLKCMLADIRLGSTRVLLCKPQTFMNQSGEAVQALQRFYKLNNSQTIVVHDELDIDFGKIRIGMGGSAAGHNGIKSLIQHIGEDFGRVRVGIGPKNPPQIDSADFVLQKFSDDQSKLLKAMTTESISIINEAVFVPGLRSETRSFIS